MSRGKQSGKPYKRKQWCDCGDEIDEEGANGQCWVCKDITPNKRNKH